MKNEICVALTSIFFFFGTIRPEICKRIIWEVMLIADPNTR